MIWSAGELTAFLKLAILRFGQTRSAPELTAVLKLAILRFGPTRSAPELPAGLRKAVAGSDRPLRGKPQVLARRDGESRCGEVIAHESPGEPNVLDELETVPHSGLHG